MWVSRATLYVNPGYLAEAIEHMRPMRERKDRIVRFARPLTGPEAATKVVVDIYREDLEDLASWGSPKPADEGMKRWLELNQSRGAYELFQVRHEVSAKGEPGKWIDRRIRYVKRGRREEMLGLWRNVPEMKPVEGFSIKVMTPRTGERAGQIMVVEITGASPEFIGLSGFTDAAAASAWAMSVHALEERQCTVELLREVD